MVVRKPESVVEEPITSFDEITPEFLAQKERHWDEVRIKELTLNSLKKLGHRRQKAKRDYDLLDGESRLRALRAINLGYYKKELADALGVSVQTINKWIRETEKK